MSGGSYDYAYSKLDDFADACRLSSPLRKAFVKHLRLCVKAMRSIEWNDSCDGDKDEVANIEAALGKNAQALALQEIVEDALKVRDELNTMIAKAQEIVK